MTYTSDEQILEILGPYTQPSNAAYEALILAYDSARYASLNPARQNLFNNYGKLTLAGDTAGALDLLNIALASDQGTTIDEEIDLLWGGQGAANQSPGSTMAMRRFAYMKLSGPSYNNLGTLIFTLMPPKAYGS